MLEFDRSTSKTQLKPKYSHEAKHASSFQIWNLTCLRLSSFKFVPHSTRFHTRSPLTCTNHLGWLRQQWKVFKYDATTDWFKRNGQWQMPGWQRRQENVKGDGAFSNSMLMAAAHDVILLYGLQPCCLSLFFSVLIGFRYWKTVWHILQQQKCCVAGPQGVSLELPTFLWKPSLNVYRLYYYLLTHFCPLSWCA